jgi:serine protease Do
MHNHTYSALGLAFFSTAALAQPTLTPEALFEQVSPSIWVVRTQDSNARPLSQGTAVVIAPGRLITNCSVLARANAVSVTRENITYSASLEFPDTERDLCQLKVANFNAPSVQVMASEAWRVGSRVYAIGSPRGLETTISDGMLSGVRRNARMELEALQITVPLSPGANGGGLFDAQGRLIGITALLNRDGQALNAALPAAWIGDLPARAQAALAAHTDREKQPPAKAAPTGDRVFEYARKDRFTGNTQRVVYRLDRVEGDTRIYNQGNRVEREGGEVITPGDLIGGEFDRAMPRGGWVHKANASSATRELRYETQLPDHLVRMQLTVRTFETSMLRVGARELTVVRVNFKGYTQRGRAEPMPSGAYEANAWYAPELGRVVRFEAKSRGHGGGMAIMVDETLELVSIRTE